MAKARAGIEKLVHLTPRTARVLRGGEEIIPAEAVKVGDILRVLPGETVPVDGVIVSGQTSINQAVMTGESLSVDKTVGDTVSSGTVNQFGAFEMKATRVGEDSSIQRMIRLVQSADAGKAKIVGIADRWATWIVGYRPDCGGAHMADNRADNSRGYDTRCVLPVRAGSGYSHRYNGGDRERHKARIPCARGRRA